MAEKHTITWDLCGATTERTWQAGSLEGWLRRDVSDSVNKRMAEGMRDYGARVSFHACPECLACANELPSPPTHPDVLAFADQKEDNVVDPPAERVARRQPLTQPSASPPEPEQELSYGNTEILPEFPEGESDDHGVLVAELGGSHESHGLESDESDQSEAETE